MSADKCKRGHEFTCENTYIRPDGIRHCIPCRRVRERGYYNSPKGRIARKNRELKRKYGITMKDFDSIYRHQEGKCAICKITLLMLGRDTCIDHSHKSGKIRGILCAKCNKALGLFADSYNRLLSAAEYIREQ
jgi:hypothetical protein